MNDTVAYLLYKWKKEESDKHRREEGVVWLTDLLTCPKKLEYEELFPAVKEVDAYNPTTLTGDIIHRGVQDILKEIYGDKFRAEVEGEKKIGSVKIRGRIDGIINDKYGLEIKHVKSDHNIPYEHHLIQAKAEKWLFNLERVELLYISRDRITSYIIDDGFKDDDIVMLLTTKNKIPRYTWQCNYCNYTFICPYRVVR